MSSSSACRPREAFADLVVRSRLCGRRHAAGQTLSAARTIYVPYVLYVGYVVGRRREQASPSPSSGRRIEGIGSGHLGPQLLPHSLAFPSIPRIGGTTQVSDKPVWSSAMSWQPLRILRLLRLLRLLRCGTGDVGIPCIGEAGPGPLHEGYRDASKLAVLEGASIRATPFQGGERMLPNSLRRCPSFEPGARRDRQVLR